MLKSSLRIGRRKGFGAEACRVALLSEILICDTETAEES